MLGQKSKSQGQKVCPTEPGFPGWIVLQTHKEKRERYARYLAEVVHDGENHF
jgi:hypothetical protein